MSVLRNLRLWLSGGVRDGRQFFWGGCALYGTFCWMFIAREYAPINAQTGAVLTLCVLALGEASVRFAEWCSSEQGHPSGGEWARWALWGRQVIALHVLVAWVCIVWFQGLPPLNAVLVALASITFGLAKTLPGLTIKGRVANTLLVALIAIPCLLVAAVGCAFGQ
jgi:hypothetical protein